MSWEAITTLAEVAGAIGVIASLIYVAQQVRSSQATAADTNRLTRATGVCDVFIALATNDELRKSTYKTYGLDTYFEAMASELNVSFDDAARTDCINSYWFWLHWGQFASTTDPKDLDELKSVVQTYSAVPAMRYSWEHSFTGKQALDSDFVEFVEAAFDECSKE